MGFLHQNCCGLELTKIIGYFACIVCYVKKMVVLGISFQRAVEPV